MKKATVVSNGLTEEVQGKISEYVKQWTEIENHVRSLLSADMPIDEKIKELDKLRLAAGAYYYDSSWQGFVTQLTHEVREDLDEIDGHVASSVGGN